MHFLLLAAADTATPELSMELRIPLSIMNFMEFGIWGAWFVVLGNYLSSLQFSRKDIGRIYGTMALGTIVAPIFGGTIADKYFASEQVMGVLHLVGAVLLFAMAQIHTPRKFYWVALLYACAYSPTIPLSGAIGFKHLPQNADFPSIRVFGTIGWIAAGLSLRFFIRPGEPMNNRPLLLAAVCSLIFGVYSFFLPHSPPPPEAATAATSLWEQIPFLKAVELLKDPSFAIFYAVSFFITIALAFYYGFTPLFLENGMKVKTENVGPMMTIGQWVEIVFMVYLPWFLNAWGMWWVLVIGMAAWGLRYALFATLGPFPLILLGVALHGICYDFFFTAAFVHVANTAPKEIANSGQSLFAVLTYGLGMWMGNELSGILNQSLTTDATDPSTGQTVRVTNWRAFWIVPCVGVAISLAAFVLFFKM